MAKVILRYTGYRNVRGDPTFVEGVPARDLSAEDVEVSGWSVETLVETGLYEKVKDKKAKSKQEVTDGDRD